MIMPTYPLTHSQRRPRPKDNRAGSTARGYGIHWQRKRNWYIKHHPLCVKCGRIATDVDHIIPRVRGGTDDEDNLQSLCHACHSRKTAVEDGAFGNKRMG
jgi:5-methylcytosine-specific restriction protein A